MCAALAPDSQFDDLPLLPLRDVVVYPHLVIPLFVGRLRSIEALEEAMRRDKRVFLVAQKSADVDDPTVDDLYEMGSVATVLQLLRLPDGTIKVLVEGEARARSRLVRDSGTGYLVADVSVVDSYHAQNMAPEQIDELCRNVTAAFEQYVKLNKKVPSEVVSSLESIENGSRLSDTIAAHISLPLSTKQEILEIADLGQRLEHLLPLLDKELETLHVDKRIRGRVKEQMERSQKEYYLNEQIKAIQKELGEMDESSGELEELAKKIEAAGMPDPVKEKATTELGKLKMMSQMSAEATVVRNYLDALIAAPWSRRSKVKSDLRRAISVLDAHHYGLEKVKDRIVEFLAVQKRVRKLKGPILCLVGPPGVGKTSLGQSIADATGRKLCRISLGGVRDEAEIRGHRRTYIGSMPGKIIQSLSKVGVKNPLVLLDEVDKMAMDFRGDPASALLEVLDPEQNATFTDHYLEVEYDLSEVMFVCTANSLNIPDALRDRLEIIRISGYTEPEKINIALRHLLPKNISNNGLKNAEITLEEDAVQAIVRGYTREAGVRNLERDLSRICRKVVKELVTKERTGNVEITPASLEHYLGVQRYRYDVAEERNSVGEVTGLAWTQVGGETLSLEAVAVPGKGKLVYTGSLGEVMRESIQAAMTVVRARAASLGLSADFHEKQDLHIHVPEGAVPKDGPSAGIGMCTAIISALTSIPVCADVAMTGEITLRGEVLPIGGLKEKLLAAQRANIRLVLIPKENEKDLVEISDDVKKDLQIQAVHWIDEVIDLALESAPVALTSPAVDVSSVAVDADKSATPPRAH